YEASLKILDEGFEDSICYLSIRNSHSRLKTTNCLERLNQEVRRGEKVIRIFSNEDSAIPLISSPSAFGNQSSLISMRTS
ncbi:MAG: transposase, partial [Anaerococcus sp.]|nr:transposase [Anaerococcus sp.]